MMRLRMKALLATILLLTGSLMAMAEDINIEVGGVNYSLDDATMTASVVTSADASGDIVLPESVSYNNKTYALTSIGEDAFSYCTSLKSIEIPSSVTSIGTYAFSASGLMSVDIPGSVVSIGERAFFYCYELSSLKLNDGLKTIGKEAFLGCETLESISIPASVESIGQSAIAICQALKSVKVEEGNKVYDSRNNCNAIIETANNSLIAGCNATTIPYGIESIVKAAFRGCEKITSIDIPSSVAYIGEEAFLLCKSLTTISIPASVTYISGNPFIQCYSLKTIIVDKANKDFDSRENCNAIIETATNKLISGCNSTLIPIGVTAIGQRAFSELKLSKIDIPATVTSIGIKAFAFCNNLTSVKIPNGVTTLGELAFFDCQSLTSVEIPASLTRIEESVFESCKSLKDVYLYGTEGKECYVNSFLGIAEDAVLHVDASLVDMYKADWNSIFSNIVPLEATGIENIHADDNKQPYRIYSVDGKQQNAMQKGINILRYKNGKTIKVMRK